MGKMSLLIVLGLSVVVGIIAYNINKSKSALSENVSGFDKYAVSRNIAHTAINMMLRRMDDQDTSIINHLVPGDSAKMIANVSGGSCMVSVRLANPSYFDTLDLRCYARYMDTTRYMKLRLRRQPVPFPTIGEAAGLYVPNVNFQMDGNPYIDGRNHDINGNLTPQPDTCNKPGVGVITPSDTSKVLPYGGKINGSVDVIADSLMSNPATFVDEYINAANVTYSSGTYGSNMTWGSVSNPWIVYANGDVKFNGNIEGWGILIVHGNLTLAGTFKFHGLVIAYQDVSIDVQFATGTPDVIGGLLMAGASGSNFIMKGNSQISYSKDAIEMAKYITRLQWYSVISWYE